MRTKLTFIHQRSTQSPNIQATVHATHTYIKASIKLSQECISHHEREIIIAFHILSTINCLNILYFLISNKMPLFLH